MTRDPEVTAAALTDVAYFVEDDNGEWATVFDGEVIQAELVDEPTPVPALVVTGWVPVKPPPEQPRYAEWVPELDPRRRYPDEATPIFDELDRRRLRRQRWTTSNHALRTALTRNREQFRLEDLAYANRVWEIEHASPLLNQLGQP